VSITAILLANGYGHTPARNRLGPTGAHHIFSFNTMEIVATAWAHEALEAVGLDSATEA